MKLICNSCEPIYKVALYLESTINGKTEHALDEEPDLIMLCNPWCASDSVYLSDEKEREEYVMEDRGLIWRGTTRSSHPCHWNFGQFEENILDTTLQLLEAECEKTSFSSLFFRNFIKIW